MVHMNTIKIEQPWSMKPEELLKQTGSSDQGLTQNEAEKRLLAYGKNVLISKAKTTPLQIFLNQFKNPILLILIFATMVSAFLHEWVDAAIILVIVLGSTVLSFYQEYSASSAAEKLKQRVQIKSKVMRDGKPIDIPAEDIVPGDIVQLSAGSLIPADGVILSSQDFYVNQSAMTGETYPVEKSPGVVAATAGMTERSNFTFMGTNVRSGSATILIVETGSATSYGQIASRLNIRPPETDFERGLTRFGNLLTTTMLILVLFILGFNII